MTTLQTLYHHLTVNVYLNKILLDNFQIPCTIGVFNITERVMKMGLIGTKVIANRDITNKMLTIGDDDTVRVQKGTIGEIEDIYDGENGFSGNSWGEVVINAGLVIEAFNWCIHPDWIDVYVETDEIRYKNLWRDWVTFADFGRLVLSEAEKDAVIELAGYMRDDLIARGKARYESE